jgi:hypothetical protein
MNFAFTPFTNPKESCLIILSLVYPSPCSL